MHFILQKGPDPQAARVGVAGGSYGVNTIFQYEDGPPGPPGVPGNTGPYGAKVMYILYLWQNYSSSYFHNEARNKVQVTTCKSSIRKTV